MCQEALDIGKKPLHEEKGLWLNAGKTKGMIYSTGQFRRDPMHCLSLYRSRGTACHIDGRLQSEVQVYTQGHDLHSCRVQVGSHALPVIQE